MGSIRGDDKILSYDDVVLRRSDLSILQGPDYINDQIIEFYFSYLSNTYPSGDVLLVPPSISFFVANFPETEILKDVLQPLALPSRKIIIFTVNDNDDVTVAVGGMHWSLLVYDREKDVFIHHDSLSLNHCVAIKLFSAVRHLMESLGSPSAASDVVEGPTPKQSNGYDCGLFVMAIAKTICQWHGCEASDKEERWFYAVEKAVASSVAELRKEVLILIENLIKQKIQKEKEESS